MTGKSYGSDRQLLCGLLLQARIEAGLGQADVGEQLGRPQSFVSDYETGQHLLDLFELEHVSAVLGLDFLELYSRVGVARKHGLPPASRKRVRRRQKVAKRL